MRRFFGISVNSLLMEHRILDQNLGHYLLIIEGGAKEISLLLLWTCCVENIHIRKNHQMFSEQEITTISLYWDPVCKIVGAESHTREPGSEPHTRECDGKISVCVNIVIRPQGSTLTMSMILALCMLSVATYSSHLSPSLVEPNLYLQGGRGEVKDQWDQTRPMHPFIPDS